MTPPERHRLLFDGDCCFCSGWARRVEAIDMGRRVEAIDFRKADLKAIDPRLNVQLCEMRIQLLERGGRLSEGFAAFKRLSLLLPLLWPLAPLFHLPGIKIIGEPAYDLVARLRFRLFGPA